MSATILNVVPSPQETSVISAKTADIEFAICDCCGLTEECTPAYIQRIRERYMGKWICGLCAEAAKDEVIRSQRLISTEEALARHMNICRKFRSPPVGDPTVHLITAMRQILRRGLDCPRGLSSAPSSPTRAGQGMNRQMLARSGSLFPALSG